jgi:ABC-type multidrug transport system ATPase subunit
MTHAAQLEPPRLAQVPEPTASVLTARGVTKRWGRGEPVLDAADFELSPGTIVGLQGVNGAGKTTLLRILAGLFFPDSGTVELDGLSPVRDRRAYQRRLGFLAAGQGGLYARMTVKAHLEYWSRLALIPAPDRRMAISLALGRLDLVPLARNRVDRLSTGQRQRVRLAMAFLHDPDVILLDEPSNSLDEAGLERLRSVLDGCKRDGKSVVWCAPSFKGVDGDFDNVYELVGGKVVAT